MAPFKSPGPDGFQARFYQSNWDVARNLVCSFVKNAFLFGYFDAALSRVLVVLVPKIDNSERLRPILEDLVAPT
ncbi:hypothetical protein CCACVL1_18205 [Corchorus capsularis]|uniref:Uncharacterized protein n=1 Tax=Corchorus capsularis TaxID=210143 RepID=A0A1R3HMJ5_COCAP|nr:hypothetical protein CCACVL1_18205 [Corchorus capsularis]